jgi:3-hydroxyisobutyrate dehydrogenase-like beta-hydroxyacid dehydrogenase
MNVSVIGLGEMGLPIARNIAKAGHTLTIYNRSRGRADLLIAEGSTATIAKTVAAASQSEIVISMLADDKATEAVVFGDGGLLASLPTGAIHISMSTISAALSARLGDAHQSVGQHFVAAPVFGRPPAAIAGQLFIVAAGDPEAIMRCQPLFDILGQRTFNMGPNPVSAHVVKLSGNFLIAAAIESMAEAFTLIRKYDIDPQEYIDLLTNTLFSGTAHKIYGGIIAREQYEPAGFRLPLGLKDVRLAIAAADAQNVPMPTASLVRDRLVSAMALGYEDKDWAVIAQVVAQNAGL